MKSGAVLSGADLSGAVLSGAVLSGAVLSGAVLSDADLRDAVLSGAVLSGAVLSGADLSGAVLSDADLRGADLSDADLRGADLRGAKINWQSHALISEILWRVAGGDTEKQMLAAFIGRRTDWCWQHWMKLETPHREWALGVLRELAAKDEEAPKCLREAVQHVR